MYVGRCKNHITGPHYVCRIFRETLSVLQTNLDRVIACFNLFCSFPAMVVHVQAQGERAFHALYYLLAGASDEVTRRVAI